MSEITDMIWMVTMLIFVTTVPTALVISLYLKATTKNIRKDNNKYK
tara:strand:- start:638 stop:775 length:138 start_codon:yes stop_codon:yes gene_type:complete